MKIIVFLTLLGLAGAGGAPAVAAPPSVVNSLTSSTVVEQMSGDWIGSYREGLARAREKKMPVLIDFRADWCGPCKMMESGTFPDPRIKELLGKFVCVRVDIDKERDTAMTWRINGIPRLIMLNPEGQVIGDSLGFMSADQLAPRIEDALAAVREKRPGTAAPGQPAAGAGAPVLPSTADGEAALKEQLATAPDDILTSAVLKIVAWPDPKERQTGLEILKGQEARVRPVLLRMLGDNRLAVRVGALEGLKKLGGLKLEFDPWVNRQARMDVFKRILTEGIMAPGPVVERAPENFR